MGKNIFKIINWVLTVIALFLWIKNIIRTSSYGLSIPFQLGGFAGAFFIPGILWLIYYITYREKTNSSENVTKKTTDIHIKKGVQDFSETVSNDISDIKNKINELRENGVLTETEAHQKINQLNKKIKDEAQAKEEFIKKQQLKSSLDSLKSAGILTQTEYDKKLNELFSQKPKTDVPQKTAQLPKKNDDEFNWGEII